LLREDSPLDERLQRYTRKERTMARKKSKRKTRDTTLRAEARTAVTRTASAVARAARTATDPAARAGRSASGSESWNTDSVAVVERLSESMDRFVDTFFGLAMPWRWARQAVRQSELLRSSWIPRLELKEEEDQVVVCADLPGVRKEDVQVELNDGMLRISGERREEQKVGEGRLQPDEWISERTYGSFYRAVRLPEGADPDRIRARMNDGVLEVSVPRTRNHSRRIDIQP
jgi:HSP20 family protein